MNSENYPWLSTLLTYFKTIKKYDTEIESFRSSISSNPNFTPLSLFSYLDKNYKSFLSLNDFKLFLASENFDFEENKLRKLIHNFDKDADFSLNLHEFTNLIKSKRNNIKNEFSSTNKLEISDEIKTDLKNILEKEMELISELNEIAKEIKNSEIFSTYEAFTVIVGKDKYITKTNFGKFLNDNYMEINEEDVNNIMFRIDADNDDKISYEEFKEIFYPLCESNSYGSKNINISENKNFNFNNLQITDKYLNKDNESQNNNYENNEIQNKEINENNNLNQNDENIDNNNDEINQNEEDNKVSDEENYINPNKKKKKITKKTILKPKLQSNINPDSESNLLYSRKPIEQIENKYIGKGKCTSCSVNKRDISSNDNILSKYNIEPKNEDILNNYEDEKISNKNILRGKNNDNILSISNNNYNNNHDHKSGNCKACQYTAKNIYNNFREKNNINSPFVSKDFTFNKSEENEEEENILLKNKLKESKENKNGDEDEDYDIYKNKDELLKKYGINSSNDNNLNYDQDNIFSNINFSTQKKSNFVEEINEQNNNKDILPPIESDNTNIVLKGKKNLSPSKTYLMQTNYSSNFKSNNLDNYEIPKNDINEKKNLLFKLWVNFIEKEKEIEKIKQSLSSCQEANPQNIFSLFNKSNSNLIKSSDILETLNSLSQNDTFEQNDIKYIFKKYNKTTSNGFTNDELNKIIFSQQIPENNDEVELEENTKNIILELFKEIIEGEKSIENSRILIEKSANNIFFDLFESIKKENKSGIEKDDIDKFMKDNEYDITNDDIDIIMEKMDKNHDGIIDYGEFIAEIRPMNFC